MKFFLKRLHYFNIDNISSYTLVVARCYLFSSRILIINFQNIGHKTSILYRCGLMYDAGLIIIELTKFFYERLRTIRGIGSPFS